MPTPQNDTIEEMFGDIKDEWAKYYVWFRASGIHQAPDMIRGIQDFWLKKLDEKISLAVQEALRKEREELYMKISDYTPDLCENSQEFKDYVISLLSTRSKDNQELICTCENTSQSSKSTAGLGGTYKCPIHYSNTKKCSSCGCIPHHLQTGLQGSNGACKCYCHNQTN